MGKSSLLFVAAVVIAGWFFFQRYEIQGLDQVRIVRRQVSGIDDLETATSSSGRSQNAIRVASFNIQVFGAKKVGKPEVMEILARAVRQFDVVAIQEIRAQQQDIIPRLLEVVNAGGRRYDYVIGPRLGRTTSKEQYAFVFDGETIEVDRNQLYTINDPNDFLHRPPLVAWFRVRGPPPDKAFTFTLVNVHTDPDEVTDEMNVMDEVMYSVRNDGRGEDDVILLGDFNTDDKHLGELNSISGITAAIVDTPTNTRRKSQYDNLIFQQPATSEYLGRSGVFDFMRQYNLTLDQALAVSDHLPVWAEFSIYEGGRESAIASAPATAKAR